MFRSWRIPTIIRYKPMPILRSFGNRSTRRPIIIARIAEIVNTIATMLVFYN